jgi:hypothetical protein
MPPDVPITTFALLRIAILKEVRTTFRERSQIAAVLVAVAMLVGILVFRLLPAVRASHSGPIVHPSGFREIGDSTTFPTTSATTSPAASPATSPTTTPAAPVDRDGLPRTGTPIQPHMNPDEIRWAGVLVAAFIGFFFSVGYLFAAVLATFVGEKEGRTLEVLLACPLSDLTLYVVKGVSVLIPSAVLAATFAAMSMAIMALAMEGTPQRVPASVLWLAPLLAIPLLVLVQAWFVGIGAAISARTETMKGAGQTLGVVLLLLCGSLYGIPAGLAEYGPVQGFVERTAADFMGRSFTEQYAVVVTLAACPAVVFLAIGRMCFRRDRMLA